MAKAQKARAANVPVPQSKDEAAQFLAAIGTAQRDIIRIEATMNDTIAAAKAAAETEAGVLKAGIESRTEGLRIWCEAHRDQLTGNGRTKSADLGTGTVAWRFQRAKVSVKGPDVVILWLQKAGRKFRKFIRVKLEINREAMLDDELLAKTVPGISIGSDGEAFVIEPFEASLEGVAA